MHVRLASETKDIVYDDSIDVMCVYELRHMSSTEQRKWMRYIKQHCPTAASLRRHLRSTKHTASKVKGNLVMHEAWLLRRKLEQCDDSEREKLLDFISQ